MHRNGQSVRKEPWRTKPDLFQAPWLTMRLIVPNPITWGSMLRGKRRSRPGGCRWHGDGVAAFQPLFSRSGRRKENPMATGPTPTSRRSSPWSTAIATLSSRQRPDRGRPPSWCSSAEPSPLRCAARITTLLADADFDAEWLHDGGRSHGIRTIIQPKRGRPSSNSPAGRWRRFMERNFARLKGKYGQRWQVESVNSMIKRRLGSALPARVEANQFREIILRAITHSVMTARLQVFFRAGSSPGHDGASNIHSASRTAGVLSPSSHCTRHPVWPTGRTTTKCPSLPVLANSSTGPLNAERSFGSATPSSVRPKLLAASGRSRNE